jgi:hypothetical protein
MEVGGVGVDPGADFAPRWDGIRAADRSAKTDAVLAAADLNPLAFIAGGRFGDINEYADITGGPVLKSSKKEVADQLARLLDQLRARYTLGYKPSIEKPEGSYCKLQVTLAPAAYRGSPARRKTEFVVRAKHGYYR